VEFGQVSYGLGELEDLVAGPDVGPEDGASLINLGLLEDHEEVT
jgi:hypothetical protein